MSDYPTYAETMRRIMEPHELVARIVAARMLAQHVISICAWDEDIISHRERFMQFVQDRCGSDCHFYADHTDHSDPHKSRILWLFMNPRDAMTIKLAWQD